MPLICCISYLGDLMRFFGKHEGEWFRRMTKADRKIVLS